MTRDEQAQDRKDETKARRQKADRVRVTGSNMMIIGGCALVIVLTISAMEPMPSWARAGGLTIAALAWLGGTDFYVGGQAMQIAMAQAAADREELDELRVEVAENNRLLLEIKQNQEAMLSRPGAADTTEATYARGFADGIEHATRNGTRRPVRLVPPQET